MKFELFLSFSFISSFLVVFYIFNCCKELHSQELNIWNTSLQSDSIWYMLQTIAKEPPKSYGCPLRSPARSKRDVVLAHRHNMYNSCQPKYF